MGGGATQESSPGLEPVSEPSVRDPVRDTEGPRRPREVAASSQPRYLVRVSFGVSTQVRRVTETWCNCLQKTKSQTRRKMNFSHKTKIVYCSWGQGLTESRLVENKG